MLEPDHTPEGKTCLCGCGLFLSGRRTKYATDECAKKTKRRDHILETYGLSEQDYNDILDFQKGLCAICGKAPKGAFNIDHSHQESDDYVCRGLLCFSCNRLILGSLTKDQIARLYEYTQNPPAVLALGRVISAPIKAQRQGSTRRRRKRRATKGKGDKLSS